MKRLLTKKDYFFTTLVLICAYIVFIIVGSATMFFSNYKTNRYESGNVELKEEDVVVTSKPDQYDSYIAVVAGDKDNPIPAVTEGLNYLKKTYKVFNSLTDVEVSSRIKMVIVGYSDLNLPDDLDKIKEYYGIKSE